MHELKLCVSLLRSSFPTGAASCFLHEAESDSSYLHCTHLLFLCPWYNTLQDWNDSIGQKLPQRSRLSWLQLAEAPGLKWNAANRRNSPNCHCWGGPMACEAPSARHACVESLGHSVIEPTGKILHITTFGGLCCIKQGPNCMLAV